MMPKRRFSERWKCRLCGGTMNKVFALTPTPIANDYAPEPDVGAFRYPLELSQCSRCGHVQQRFIVEGMFDDYKYTTPQTVARYLEPFVDSLLASYPRAKRVLEIGSNNGTYLQVLRSRGFDAVGVDPAATGEGNHVGYFTAQWANRHNEETKGARYDLIAIDDGYRAVFGTVGKVANVWEDDHTLDVVLGRRTQRLSAGEWLWTTALDGELDTIPLALDTKNRRRE